MSKNLITNNEFVLCPYCNDETHHKMLTSDHLKKHSKTLDELRKEFPDNPTMCSSVNQKANDNRIKKLQEKYPDWRDKDGNKIVNISQLKEVSQKAKKTRDSIPDYYEKREEVKKQTNLIRYDVEHTFQSKDVIIKIKETKQQKYDDPNYNNVSKAKETIAKNPNHYKDRQIKIEDTNMKERGVKYPTQDPNVILTRKENNLVNWGVEETLSHPDIRKSIESTNLRIRGVKYPTQDPNVILTRDINNIKKIGATNYMKLDKYRNMFREREIKKYLPQLIKSLKKQNVEFVNQEYIGAHVLYNFKCLKCNHIFETSWFNIQQSYKCPKCYPRNKGYSIGELEVREIIKSFNLDATYNDRNLLKPLEIDIIIESKKVCIEYCGLYYHNEDKLWGNETPDRTEFYHSFKVDECYKKGYRLITIFEDEWLQKQDIVISRLKQILGKFDGERIHGRECEIKEIDSKTKDDFLMEFHIQGKDISSVRLGAFYNNNLVSVMTFSHGSISKGIKNKSELIWELSRFCSNSKYHIPGIAGKLLNHFKENFKWIKIFTYADRRWSVGNMYEKLDFKSDGKPRLNYWYCKDSFRIHRFNLRKRPDEPKDVPEKILRFSEGYTIIWDCGNLKYILEK